MIGWFLAGEAGNCDRCGAKTKRNERVYHDGGDPELRMCEVCAHE